jgi:hypothetical protein
MTDWVTILRERGWREVATGTWLYSGSVPYPITVWAKPASESYSRYDWDDQLDESRPIPETRDGFLYCTLPGQGEYLTIDDAKTSADSQPWGPVTWNK